MQVSVSMYSPAKIQLASGVWGGGLGRELCWALTREQLGAEFWGVAKEGAGSRPEEILCRPKEEWPEEAPSIGWCR
jgi:hypothetical protein